MNKNKWLRYYFTDGYVVEYCYKLNKYELAHEEEKHGKCLKMVSC